MMNRALRTLTALLLLAPAVALADDLSATLTGTGQGLASLVTGNNRIDYTLFVAGIGTPARATVRQGETVVVDLGASFAAGAASGRVSNVADLAAIIANPRNYTVRVEGSGGVASGVLANASTGGGVEPPTGEALTLMNGRFKVRGRWRNQFDGSDGNAKPVAATDLSGYFTFTDDRNIELLVKILEFGDGIRFFYGQLTNLQFTLTVEDTRTGAIKSYANGPNNCGAIDDSAAPKLGVASPDARALWFAEVLVGEGIPSAAHLEPGRRFWRKLERGGYAAGAGARRGKAACVSAGNRLCLLGDRIQVELGWRNQFDGSSGSGAAAELSDFTGSFAFTDPRNVEVLIKALEFSDGVRLFWGSLSNLEYTLRVTDTVTGATETYTNAANTYCGGFDNDPF